MPTLDWIGKKKVVNHHLDVPFKVLNKQYTFSADGKAQDSENKIIHGDNLEALKTLLPEYEGKVKCIYIDPPYNTGEENWVYNDNVKDTRIEKWLGQIVGKESEDLSRHDKWLCMMYPRLKMLYKLLAEDGAIFISIDDNEVASLKLICEEIFGKDNFLAEFIWEKRTSRENRKVFSVNQDYILAFAKNRYLFELNRGSLPYTDDILSRYSNPDNDPRGSWQSVALTVQGGHGTKTQFYTITTPSGRKIDPPSGLCWRYTEERLNELIDDKRITFGKDGNNVPRLKLFLNEMEQGVTPHTLWKSEEVGTTDVAKREILDLFNGESVFDTPKPTSLICRILQIFSKEKDYIVLDSYAGSGTTAHAVLNLNKADNGHRKFILIEMEDYAEKITAERIKKVIKGYKAEEDKEELLYEKELTIKNLSDSKTFLEECKQIEESSKSRFDKIKKILDSNCLKVLGIKKSSKEVCGTSGDFSYYELGEPLLVDGLLNEKVDVSIIREYIWFTETHSKLSENSTYDNEYFLGKNNDAGYWFYYKKNEETCLNYEFLSTMKTKAEQYIIYADVCRLPESFLKENNIVFKKIPREIQKF